MQHYESISSALNPRIRTLLQLQQKSSERRQRGLFVVEGERELRRCLRAGFEADTLFFCPDIVPPETLSYIETFVNVKVFAVSRSVYEKIAYRGSTEGVMAEVRIRKVSLEELYLEDNPLVMVLESVEKPGNLGAVLRSADAAGADAVIVCDPMTDLFNPNLIRSSLGAVFTVPCVACSSAECIHYLQSRHIRILTAQLQDSELYYDTDMTTGVALVMGTESTGLTQQWRAVADAHIRIPMSGQMDSLNVSVSAAVLLYEAVRQRHSSK